MDANIEVYIDNYKVDIGRASSIRIKKQLKDVKEFSKRKTSFSKPVSVLHTQHNAKLFGAAFNINKVGGWDLNSRPSARIVINGNIIDLDAVKLVSITSKEYRFIAYKNNINLDVLLGDELIKGNSDLIKDINFTNQYPLDFTRPNLRGVMSSDPLSGGSGINYCHINYDAQISTLYDNDRLLVPSIAVRELLEETISSIGKTITFSAGILKYLNSMYMPFNGDYKELTTPWDYAKYSCLNKDIVNNSPFFDMLLIEGLKCQFDKIQDIPTEAISTRTKIKLTNNIGEYKITFKCSVKKTIDNGFNPEVKPRIVLNTIEFPNVVTDLKLINNTQNADEGIFLPDTNFHDKTFEAFFKLQGGATELYIGFDTNILPDSEGVLEVNTDGSTFVEIQKIDSYYNEDTPTIITSNKILPVGYKKKDLFNDVVSIFNATLSEDDGNIYMQTANEFNASYNPIFKDYSDKIEDEDSIELATLLSVKSEITAFKFKDASDLYNSDYLEQFKTGFKDLDRIEQDKNTITKNLNSASSERIDIFTHTIGDSSEYTVKSSPRILFVSKYRPSIDPMTWGLDKEGSRARLIAGLHYLSPRFSDDTTASDNLILAFSNADSYSGINFLKETNGTIYNRFYKNDEELLLKDDSIFLNAEFNLTPRDIAELEFNDIVFIKTKKHGSGYFRINEVNNFDTGSNKLTKCEFIQIDLETLTAPDFISSEITLNQVSLSRESQSKLDELANTGVVELDFKSEEAIVPELPLTANMILTPTSVVYGKEGDYTCEVTLSNPNLITVGQLVLWRYKSIDDVSWTTLTNETKIVPIGGLILSETMTLGTAPLPGFPGEYDFEVYVLGVLEDSINIGITE